MKRVNRVALAGSCVAAWVVLAGCGLLDSESDTADAPPSTPQRSESAPAAGAGTPSTSGNAPVTAPGTKLRVGQRAVVPYKSGSRTGTLGITVTTIEPGDQAAFRQRFGAKAANMVPYYIRYTVENVGGTDLSTAARPLLNGVGPDGGSTGAVVVGTIPGCERKSSNSDFSSAGAKYQACRLQAARKGRTVAGAVYEDDTGGYRNKPIIWTTS